jgi:RNA polymerase sigma-70 factor (ECF subfamily)
MIKEKDLILENIVDEELINYATGKHRKKVLAIIYDRYEKRIFFKAYSMLRDKQAARDLTHDIFIKIFLNLSKFKANSRFSLWIHSISVNTCLNYIKKNKNIVVSDMEEFQEEKMLTVQSTDQDKIIDEIKVKQLYHLLSKLKEVDRLLFIMKYADGLTIAEITSILNLSTSAVKMRLKRTREKIYSLYLIHYDNKNN